MDGHALVGELAEACRELKGCLDRLDRRWLDGIMAGKRERQVGQETALDIDRVYEFLCYFALLAGIAGKTQLTCVTADGQRGYRLPYGPGNKGHFAFFRLTHNGQTYDLCCGTALPVPDEPSEHPDISLQEMAPGHLPRSPGTPVAIWDAKYHDGSTSKADLQQMNWWCDMFRDTLMKYRDGDILADLFPRAYQVTAVLTNGPKKCFNITQLLKRGFSVVFNYTGFSSITGPTPTRQEHIAHQAREATGG